MNDITKFYCPLFYTLFRLQYLEPRIKGANGADLGDIFDAPQRDAPSGNVRHVKPQAPTPVRLHLVRSLEITHAP